MEPPPDPVVLSPDNPKKRHRRTAAEIERSYKCDVAACGKMYGSEGALKMHYKLKHPEHPRNKTGSSRKSPSSLSPRYTESDCPSSPQLPPPLQPLSESISIQSTSPNSPMSLAILSSSLPLPHHQFIHPTAPPPSQGTSPRYPSSPSSIASSSSFSSFHISKPSGKADKPLRYKFLEDRSPEPAPTPLTPHTPLTPITPQDHNTPQQQQESFTPVMTSTSPSTSLVVAHLKIGDWERGSFTINDIVARFAHEDHVAMWEIEEFDVRQRIAFSFDAIQSIKLKFSNSYSAYAVIFELNTSPRFFQCQSFGAVRWVEVADWIRGSLLRHTILLRQDPSDALDYVFASHTVAHDLWLKARVARSGSGSSGAAAAHAAAEHQRILAQQLMASNIQRQQQSSILPPPPVLPPGIITTSAYIPMTQLPTPPPPLNIPVMPLNTSVGSQHGNRRDLPPPRPPPMGSVAASSSPPDTAAAAAVAVAAAVALRQQQAQTQQLPPLAPLGSAKNTSTTTTATMSPSNAFYSANPSPQTAQFSLSALSTPISSSLDATFMPDDFLVNDVDSILPLSLDLRQRTSTSSSGGRGSGILRGLPSATRPRAGSGATIGGDISNTVTTLPVFESASSGPKSSSLTDPFTDGLLVNAHDALSQWHIYPSRAEHLLFMQEYQSRSSSGSKASSGSNSATGSLSKGDAPLHLF